MAHSRISHFALALAILAVGAGGAWAQQPEQPTGSWANETSGAYFYYEGYAPHPIGIGLGAGKTPEELAQFLTRGTYADARPGGWDPAERLKDNELDGVEADVLYTTLGFRIFWIKDFDLQAECFRVYNDWLAAYCSYAPTRMAGLAMISLYDPKAGAQELERCVRAGLKGAMIWCSPPADRPYSSAIYDPFWAAAQALRTPVSLHAITGMGHESQWDFGDRYMRATVLPHEIERSTYVLCASLALLLLFWQWRPLGGVVWSVEEPVGRIVLRGLFALGWGLVLVSTFLINHFDLFGLRQSWRAFRGQPQAPLAFVTPAVAFQRPRTVSGEARRVADDTIDDPVPADIDAAEAVSLVLNGVTARQLLRAANVRRGRTILVHGIGGLLAINYAWFSIRLMVLSHEIEDISTATDATPLWIPQLGMAIGTTLLAVAVIHGLVNVLCHRVPLDAVLSGEEPGHIE